MPVAEKTEKHYFVINAEGKSAHRKGAFVSAEAAKTWVGEHYPYQCWLVPAEYIGKVEAKPLDEKGNEVRKA